jgi:hypothetical protein
MIIKGQLLSAKNLNNAYISKTDTNAQSISSNLTISGGALTLKNSQITDNANTSYMRIDPQGNQVIIYDGVNNQRLDVFSSSGSESTYIQTINGTTSIGQIDVSSAVDHLEVNTNSSKYTLFGGDIRTNGVLQAQNPANTSATMFLGWLNNDPRIRIGGTGSGSAGTFRIQGTSDIDRFTVDTNGNTWSKGTLTATGKITASGGVGIYSSNTLSFDTYGGGFNMVDTTWVRITGGKSFYQASGTLRTDGTLQVNSGITLSAPSGGTFSLHSGKFTVATGGAITSVGPFNMTTSKSAGTGISIDGMNIDTVGGSGGDIVLRNLKQLRFSDVSGWDWNLWAGIKYDSTNLKMYIGGPASAQFTANANPATIDVAFTGVGNVGIGTDTPVEKLDVAGNIKLRNGDSIWIGNNADSGDRLRLHHSGADGYIDFGSGNLHIRNVSTTDVMYINSGGSVGIGTTSPLRLLDVNGSARINGSLYGGPTSLSLFTDAGGALPIKAGSLAITSSYSNSAPTNGLYVQGNTGIGTASPVGKLHVVDSSQEIYTGGDHLYLKYTGAGHYPYIGFLDSGGTRGGYLGYGVPGSYMGLYLENGNNLYIGGGSVGIGTTTPAQTLDVFGSIQANTQFMTKSNGDVFQAIGTGSAIKTFRYDNSSLRFWNPSYGEIMTLTSGSNVGINQTSPAYTLDIGGTLNVNGLITSPASNSPAYQVGDDAQLWDINVANTMGVYGKSNTAVGGIKLGSTGPTIYGSGSTLGINTTAPDTTVALDVNGHIKIGAGRAIFSGYNNDYIIKDFNNGNVTLSATNLSGGQLYLGYSNTSAVRLSSKLVGSNGTTNIAGTDGTLYYQGQDTDTRYVNATGDTVSGNMTITGTLNLTSTNDVNASGNGILVIGPTNSYNMQLDGNEMQGFNNGVAGNLSLNLNGGDVVLGSTTNLKFSTDTKITANARTAIEFFGPDNSGMGLALGAGGLTILGGGESAQTVKTALLSGGSTGGTESLYLTSDNEMTFLAGQNLAYDATNYMSWDDSTFKVKGGAFELWAGSVPYYGSTGNTGGDGVWGTNSYHIGANSTLSLWSQTGSIKIQTGTQNATTTRFEVQNDGDVLVNGLYVDTHYKSPAWKSITTSGWYRIASVPSSNARAYGRFMVMDTSASRHEIIDFTAGTAFNKPESINLHMLGRSKYGSGETIGGVRILVATTYDPQYLEVYLVSGCSVQQYAEYYDRVWYGGWQPVDFTFTSTVPTGYDSTSGKLEMQDGYYRNQNVLSGTTAPPTQGAFIGDIYVQY